MTKYLCIHGHFYQPPRENAWLNKIPNQPSAAPFDNWNERISKECYAANTIIGDSSIRNNLSYINFNFGPTLLSWLKENDFVTYQNIIEADRLSQDIFEGHGSAMSQCYNHIIMPLATLEDKRTQIIWGIRDFEYHYKRKPEGMWLPETAVDIETLEIMVESGIRYTILAPHQIAKVRAKGEDAWHDVAASTFDTTQPYTCLLPSGKTISIFVYKGPLANDIAFGEMLDDVDKMTHRFNEIFDGVESGLLHTVTDGETYGHHRKEGHLTLNKFLVNVKNRSDITLTNYGLYLAKDNITHEICINDNSSWSCAHGIERWRSDCGCCVGQADGWTQEWRTPLRDSLNWLKGELDELFKTYTNEYGEMWVLRNNYIDYLLTSKGVDDPKLLKILEMQKLGMYMFTSCGWFFDDIARIEPQQILQYAVRAMELAKELNEFDLFDEFLNRIVLARSNCIEAQDGKKLCQEIRENKGVIEYV